MSANMKLDVEPAALIGWNVECAAAGEHGPVGFLVGKKKEEAKEGASKARLSNVGIEPIGCEICVVTCKARAAISPEVVSDKYMHVDGGGEQSSRSGEVGIISKRSCH